VLSDTSRAQQGTGIKLRDVRVGVHQQVTRVGLFATLLQTNYEPPTLHRPLGVRQFGGRDLNFNFYASSRRAIGT
jgi:hypothetical protein